MKPAVTALIESVRLLQQLLIPKTREVGDVRRNASLYLSRKAGASNSSFNKGLSIHIDESRLTELAYLSAIGFLVGADSIQAPLPKSLVTAVGKVSKRTARTAERSGYADDPINACGLLILAKASQNAEFVHKLTKELTSAPLSNPALQVLLTVTLEREVQSSHHTDESSAVDLAAAALLRRFNENLGRRSFPGLGDDIESRLASTVVLAEFEPSVDFNGMIVLAALESCLTLPSDDQPSLDGPCDVGIIVALKEEFRVLHERLNNRYNSFSEGGRTYYVFEAASISGSRPYRCVATFIGDMGTNRAGILAEKLMGTWKPAAIVMIGIAGGIHNDVRLADLVVASQVDGYLEGAKVADGSHGSEFQRRSDSFKCDSHLIDRVRNFEFSHQSIYRKWLQEAKSRTSAISATSQMLIEKGLLREAPDVREGNIASGPLVVTSRSFIEWIKKGDRSCLAVEMEGAGLMLAAHLDTALTPALVIRGISDFGDDRKAELDRIGGGSIRTLAMQNCTGYLFALMESGILPRRQET